MAATTIFDLPRDALVLIFRAVLDASTWDAPAGSRPHEIHQNLRCMSREWRDAADIAYIEHEKNSVMIPLRDLPNPATVRARFPSLIHEIFARCLSSDEDCWAPTTALAFSSLCASPDLRRVLKRVTLEFLCCADEAAAVVSALSACPHLTSLEVGWGSHLRDDDDGDRPDILAPLGALTGLKQLAIQTDGAWPTLPDCTSLTSLEFLLSNITFVPVGSDASLGRLRRLSLWNSVDEDDDQWSSNDPLYLRADLDAGVWQPNRLTSLQELRITLYCGVCDDEWEPHAFDGAAPAAAVWAPLAPTVTKLELTCESSIFYDSDVETGMYAGLGVLTGLQDLVVDTTNELRSPVDFGRVHLPHLTALSVLEHRGPPIDLARFPRLARADLRGYRPPLVLSSVTALRRLESLSVSGFDWARQSEDKPRLNLAQLFGGGRPLASLTKLSFDRVALAWDATAVAGAPSGVEFAARARTLLPSLRSVEIKEDMDMDEAVREFVVPAVLALGRG